MDDPEFDEDYPEDGLEQDSFGPSGNDWTDPDWYDDDWVDECLEGDGAPVGISALRKFWFWLRWTFHPNRLRKCPQCHTRGHATWHEGMCAGCWIPF